MNQSARVLIALFLLLVGGIVFYFYGAGEQAQVAAPATVSSADPREPMVLNGEQQQHVLAEMRGFLGTVRDIQVARAEGDWDALAKAAAAAGPGQNMQPVPGMRQAQPDGFRQMGQAMRQQFAAIAEAARAKDGAAVDSGLSTALSACMSCHETYRIELKQ